MQSHPVREIYGRGVHRSGGDSPNRETNGREPRVLVYRIGAGRIGRSFKIVQREAHRHAQFVGQPCANKRFIASCADPFDEETSDVVAEVIVLPGSANIAAGFKIAHGAQQFSGGAIAWEPDPIMAWQTRLM